jgi:two-component system, NarL family, response regulator YdfI
MRTALVATTPMMGHAQLGALAAARPRLRVLAAAAGTSLVEQVRRVEPDVLLVDGRDADLRGALRRLARLPHAPAVIMFAGTRPGRFDADDLRLGIRGVLAPDADLEVIGAAIEAVAAGFVVLDPAALRALPRRLASPGPAGAGQALTPRETEVLGMMTEGLGNKQIADRLGISARTVKFHAASIFGKLGAGSRTEAVAIGLRQGLILI